MWAYWHSISKLPHSDEYLGSERLLHYLQMCQLNLQDNTRNVALGTNAAPGVEWDGDNVKSFTLRYKGGDLDDKKKERYAQCMNLLYYILMHTRTWMS